MVDVYNSNTERRYSHDEKTFNLTLILEMIPRVLSYFKNNFEQFKPSITLTVIMLSFITMFTHYHKMCTYIRKLL